MRFVNDQHYSPSKLFLFVLALCVSLSSLELFEYSPASPLAICQRPFASAHGVLAQFQNVFVDGSFLEPAKKLAV